MAPDRSAECTIEGSPGLIDYLGGQGFEAQQRLFDADELPFLAIGADAALTYFRWVLARRIEAEGNTARAA
jgi:hypothetical protein